MRKRTLDLELEAIATVTNALARLTPVTRTRVIGYALKRLEDEEPTEEYKEVVSRRSGDSLDARTVI